METKGAVLDKTYLTTVPTVIAWDGCAQSEASAISPEDGDDEEDIWKNMEYVS
jgi:ribosome biogenesis protein NSA1